jgi:hypothetical protein
MIAAVNGTPLGLVEDNGAGGSTGLRCRFTA